MRNENIADLVRFFQAQEDTEDINPPKESTNGNMDLIKASQRRLRHLGQAKPKKAPAKGSDTSSISSSDKRTARRQHLIALQREGLLSGLGDSTDKSRPLRTKQDVEAIGRPWLDDALGSRTSNDDRSTSQTTLSLHDVGGESLSLGDFAALVEFSVSFPELYPHETSPPPYQARAQSDQSESQGQPHSLSNTLASSTDRRYTQANHNRNEDNQLVTMPSGGQSRDSRVDGANSALAKTAQGHRVAGAPSTGSQAQSKPNIDKANDGSCCGFKNCDCDDAKSLAILLRATERLGVEKRKANAQNASASASTSPIFTDATTNRTAPLKTICANAATEKPHSLNQGVTDTPLFERKLVEEKVDGVEAAEEPSTKASDQPSSLNAGPIPLKLVAECMSPTNFKPVFSPQPLSPQDPRRQAKNQGRLMASVPPRSASSIGPSLATFPHPGSLLSPIPIQSRRSRSATPDVAASDSVHKKGKKKGKRAPLYVITDAAPLPPPAKPLPLIPQSASHHTAPRERNISTPVHPVSAPLEYREEDRDSPILGMNTQKGRLRRSLIGRQSSSRPSSMSNDISDRTSIISDDQTLRSASPAFSRPESRRGRADQVHALRKRDLDASKKKEDNSDAPQIKRNSITNMQSYSPSQSEVQNSSRRHRVSAAPDVPLPRDPPVNAQGTLNHRRRNSATSLARSVATTNGYEGGLSRSASVTSGSIESLSIRQGKIAYPPRVSSLLPSSDEERHKPRPRTHKDALMAEAGTNEQKAAGTQKAVYYPEPLSPSLQITYDAALADDSQINYLHLVRSLESRVASLERQNKMLQAALLAALDAGVSHDADSAHSRSISPSVGSARTPMISERSLLSPHGLDIDTARNAQRKPSQMHHQSRNASYTHDDVSQESRGSFETTSSHSSSSLRDIEVMLSDVDVGDSTRKSRQ